MERHGKRKTSAKTPTSALKARSNSAAEKLLEVLQNTDAQALRHTNVCDGREGDVNLTPERQLAWPVGTRLGLFENQKSNSV